MRETFAFYITVLRKDFKEFCGQRLQAQGVSMGLLYFLIYIGKHPNCGPGQVSEALGADTGHTTRSVEKLVSCGLVHRQRREDDKRAFQLSLTEQGEEAFRTAHEVFREWDEQALSGLSQSEREAGISLLHRLLLNRGWEGGNDHV